jgi:flagellar biosynthesis protein FlhB
MLPARMDEARTEAATPRKRARAREQGLVARSPHLGAAAAILALMLGLGYVGPEAMRALQSILVAALRAAQQPGLSLALLWPSGLERLTWLASGLLLMTCAATWLGGFIQVGPFFSAASITPDLRRLDPAARLRQLALPEHWLDLIWTALKIAIVGAVVAFALWSSVRALMAAPAAGPLAALERLGAVLSRVLYRVGIAALLLGAVDLIYQRVRHGMRLRMSRRELDQEMRESYGLPEQRALRMRLYRESAALATLAAIEGARLVLRGQGGRVIALGFDAEDTSQRAPRLVAKTEAALAPRVLASAEQAGIAVCWDPDLVSALYRLELTEEIPGPCYERVAELFRATSRAAS